MKILGLQDGSGCGFYRMVTPLQELAKHGHEVTLVDKYKVPVRKYLAEADQWDVIVGERFDEYDLLGNWRRARHPGNRLVFENDDDVFNVAVENWAAYNLYQKSDVRDAVGAFSEYADLVTVTTEPLAEVYREFNQNVAVLPNCVPDVAFDAPSPGAGRPYGRRLRLGWVGGASHGRDIHTATAAVRRFIQRTPDWDLYLGGTDYRPTFKVPLDRAHYEPWINVADDTEAYYSSFDFDIGLCPLLETDFSRSKSAIKAIEYGARGIPVVASDATPYRSYIEHGYNGFLAKTEHEWLKYLSLLASDEDLRLKMGENARTAAGYYRISDRWKQWEAAYEGMFK